MLLSNDKSKLYKGLTSNIERRLYEHSHGQNDTTKFFGKFSIVLLEEYNTRSEARDREKYLKSGGGREYLKELVNNK